MDITPMANQSTGRPRYDPEAPAAPGSGSAGARGGAAPRPRVVVQFPLDPDEMVLSGVLVGGQALANCAQVVDIPMGEGHVMSFAIRPFWRGQTQRTFVPGFNTILHWNDPTPGGRGTAGDETALKVHPFDYHRGMDSGGRIGIVGAGVIGCALAFELSRRGAAVTVLDARSPAGGATQASAGILAPYTEAHEGGALFDLTVRGLEAYDAFVAQVRDTSPIPFEYARAGTLEIAEDEERGAELRDRLSMPWTSDARLEWLAPDALRAAAPAVNPAAVGALLCAVHGHVAVGAFTDAMADAAVRLGARFTDRSKVERIVPGSTGVTVRAAGRAPLEFDRIALCAGSWTPEIDPAGITAGRIRPVRGQLVRLRAPQLVVGGRVLWGRSCYTVPWEDGTLLVGATSEEVGFDERATASGVRGLLAAAEELLPGCAEATFVDVRVGLRPASANGVPILGPGPDPRILYAVGHYRNGVLLAPLTAQLLGDAILENRRDPVFVTS